VSTKRKTGIFTLGQSSYKQSTLKSTLPIPKQLTLKPMLTLKPTLTLKPISILKPTPPIPTSASSAI